VSTAQISFVHGLPSSHWAGDEQQPAIGVNTQRRVVGLQVSVVQALASVQSPSVRQQPCCSVC
jgi:hypothetical protein